MKPKIALTDRILIPEILSPEQAKKKIAQTDSTLIPAILALEQAGFAVNVSWSKNGPIFWAVRDSEIYEGDNPETVLGLVKLVEMRGRKWQANDEEIYAAAKRHRLLQ